MRNINSSLPIPELIKLIKHSFRESDFDEVEKILMDREMKMKTEMDSTLMKERHAMRNEVKLLERKHDLSEFETAKLVDKCKGLERRIVSLVEEKKVVSGNVKNLEEKLGESVRKCEGLERRITGLVEEKRVFSDSEKRATEQYDKVCEEKSKMGREKDQIIVELKKKNLDNERSFREYQEKYQTLDAKVRRMEGEMKDLREEKLKADKAAEDSNKRLENLAPMIFTVEKSVEQLIGALREDIPEGVNELDKLGKDVKNHGASAVQNSPGPQSLPARSQMEIIATDHEHGSKKLPPSGDIIDLCDSDDESAHIANATENATNILNRGDVDKGRSPISSTLKRKRSLMKNDHTALSMVQVFDPDSDDEPCLDSDMDNLLASNRSKKCRRVDVPGPSKDRPESRAQDKEQKKRSVKK